MEETKNRLETLSVADLMFGKELLESDIRLLLDEFKSRYGVQVSSLVYGCVDGIEDLCVRLEV